MVLKATLVVLLLKVQINISSHTYFRVLSLLFILNFLKIFYFEERTYFHLRIKLLFILLLFFQICNRNFPINIRFKDAKRIFCPPF